MVEIQNGGKRWGLVAAVVILGAILVVAIRNTALVYDIAHKLEKLDQFEKRLDAIDEKLKEAPARQDQPALQKPSPDKPTGSGASPAAANSPVPFQLELEQFEIEGLPGLHSVAHAVHDGKLVLLSGRVNGLHGFAPSREAPKAPAFPRDKANDTVYVVDLPQRKVLGHAKVGGLPKAIADQLRATNTQYVSRGEWLYIVGGYGSTPDDRTLVTLDQVLAVHLPALITHLSAGKELDADFARAHMRVGSHKALAITGGDLALWKDRFVLIFGHRFDGEYTPGAGLASQEYSESVRLFEFELSEDRNSDEVRQVNVKYLGKEPAGALGQDPDGPFHRRDLPADTLIDSNGDVRLVAYGGVFKGGRFEGYLNPVYISVGDDAKVTLQVDTTVEQLMNQYKCPVVSAYSRSHQVMYATFFGGMSQYWWDAEARVLKRDTVNMMLRPPQDGFPFVNTISTLRMTAQDKVQYLHAKELFPPRPLKCGDHSAAYLGSETIFVLADGVANERGVILLDDLRAATTVGYLLGGIASTGPYPPNGTCASPAIYRVRLVPDRSTSVIRLEKPDPPMN